ncbi:MAG TPA: glycerophosphodiester phosphodiesterase family protein [Actinospica sp.]|nr:glycerophosphodiester phosphodiesterase family protein [Actinospica sp.]
MDEFQPPTAAPRPTERGPLIVAHRGASTEAPEHTYAAYVAAVQAGADALECDVRLTADGHLVCVHDRRVNRTSNGTGLVSGLELARLQELDFGFRHQSLDGSASGEEPDLDARGVLTLRRLLDLVADQPRRVELAIEVKHPTRYAGRVEHVLVELLDEYGWAPRRHEESCPVLVMSFSASAVRRVRRLAPGLRTVFLMESIVYLARAGALPRGVPIAGPAIEILRTRPEAVRRWHRAGHEVHVWTVDEPADFELCRALGVDAVITNRPRAMLRALSGVVRSHADRDRLTR